MKRIFVLEDDPNISSIIDFNLKAAGYDTALENDGQVGLERLKRESADLVMLDIMLPSMDGFEVLKNLREFSDVPVIILSARTDETDRLEGLSLLADDYVTKPFSVAELMARVKVNLLRYAKSSNQDVYTVGDLTVDCKRFAVTKGAREISLSPKEFELLMTLLENRGIALSREHLLRTVWGYGSEFGDLHTVDVTIGRLRAKVENKPSEPEIILSRRGAGYYIV